MSSVAIQRIKARIGDMGLPGVIWPVYSTTDEAMRAFYDREKAEAFVKLNPMWFVANVPLKMQDAQING